MICVLFAIRRGCSNKKVKLPLKSGAASEGKSSEADLRKEEFYFSGTAQNLLVLTVPFSSPRIYSDEGRGQATRSLGSSIKLKRLSVLTVLV
jgi:hypothetical protein